MPSVMFDEKEVKVCKIKFQHAMNYKNTHIKLAFLFLKSNLKFFVKG